MAEPLYALTIWQPWAHLIMAGLKTVEFRSWPPPRSLVGRRLVIHAGAKDPRPGLKELLASVERLRNSCLIEGSLAPAQQACERMLDHWQAIPRRCGLGTALIGEPFKRAGWDHWAWPLGTIERWDEPVPCNGAQGLWPWPQIASRDA